MGALLDILDKVPNCVPLEPVNKHKQKTGDYLYDSNLVVEVKEVAVKSSRIMHDLHEQMRKEAGILSTVDRISFAELASRTHRPNFWYKRFKNKVFRPLETHLRSAKEQTYQTCSRTGASYGVILVGITGDAQTIPEDFGPLCASFIKRYVDRGDQEIRSLSEIALIHFGQVWRDTGIEHETAVQLVQTEFGMSDGRYKRWMNQLLEDMSLHSSLGDMAFLDNTDS